MIHIGDKFGEWTIIEMANDRVDSSGRKHKRYLCQCKCGNILEKDAYKLLNGAKMCKQCYLKIAKNNSIPFEHKKCIFEFTQDYCIVYANNTGASFFFDKEDYDKVVDICWDENKSGYLVGYDNNNKKHVFFHRVVMNVENDKIVDHINRNKKDCRKTNLRICNQSDNTKNKSRRKDNRSGTTGVYFDKKRGRWISYIGVNGKNTYLGSYLTIDEAIHARKNAEIFYFGEFAPKS